MLVLRLIEGVEAYKQHVETYKQWEPVPGAANKQMNMAAERKSHRALGDIGNLITICEVDEKAIPQVSRPVIRSFCAQLLANAQAERIMSNVLAANIKKPIVVDGLLPEKRAAVRLPVLIIEKWVKRAVEEYRN
ncbi:hypothetical protein OROMI_033984 [Orobanche minor]